MIAKEKKMSITFQGNPLTLTGNKVKVGDKAPKFMVLKNDLSPLTLSETKGVRVFITFPSIDTPVCDLQVKRFNQEAAKLRNVSIYAVSADLPFGQARWCGANGASNLVTVSDHRDMQFATNWGLFIKELRLLARAVFVVNSAGNIVYSQIVGEVTDQPDYEAALAAVKAAA